jgi:hypothetical protein
MCGIATLLKDRAVANPEHIAILKQGVDAWNAWRAEKMTETKIRADASTLAHIQVHPRKANLSGADLHGMDLFRVHLAEANLSGADLSRANLNQADLSRADLSRANLSGADLNQAFLAETNFSGANLTGADLSEADLSEVNFSWATLNDSDFYEAFMWGATLMNNDLATVKGLDTVRNVGPSTIDVDTIYRSKGRIPDRFLRGIGVPEDLIVHIRSVDWKAGYPSCFISYSSKDQKFVDRLYVDLQSKGVRSWLATRDLKTGDRYPERIENSIRGSDKLLIVLSKYSINSRWVEGEVRAALEKEGGSFKRTVLIPIRLDDKVMDTIKPWAADIRRTRQIGDFRGWQVPDSYEEALGRLLRDLKSQNASPQRKMERKKRRRR